VSIFGDPCKEIHVESISSPKYNRYIITIESNLGIIMLSVDTKRVKGGLPLLIVPTRSSLGIASRSIGGGESLTQLIVKAHGASETARSLVVLGHNKPRGDGHGRRELAQALLQLRYHFVKQLRPCEAMTASKDNILNRDESAMTIIHTK